MRRMNPNRWARFVALLTLILGATGAVFLGIVSSDAYMGLVGTAVAFYFRRDDQRHDDGHPKGDSPKEDG